MLCCISSKRWIEVVAKYTINKSVAVQWDLLEIIIIAGHTYMQTKSLATYCF